MRERFDAIVASRWLVPVGLPLLTLLSLLRPLAPAARRLLDRRGDLGRHRARALDVDPAPPARGRLAAALLHAARHLGASLRRQRGGDAHALARLRARVRAARVLRGARGVRTARRARCARARGARPVPHVLRAGDADVRARGAALARRRVVVRRRDPARPRGSWTPVFVVATALLAYSHNWGLFLCVGLAVATFAFARERLRLFGIAAVGVAVLYAPWLPTLLSQARHTGAPWSTRRASTTSSSSAGTVIGGDAPYVALVLVGGAALGGIVVHERNRRSGARSPRCSPSARSRSSSRSSPRRSRPRGRRATSPSSSGRSCSSPATRSRARAGSGSRRWSRSSSSSPATRSRTTRRTRRGSPPELGRT